MIWYLLMCFTGSSGVHCMKMETPSYYACVQVLPSMRVFAEQRRMVVEVSCIRLEEYV